MIGDQRTGTIHRTTPLAQTKHDCFDVGGPGYEKGKRRDCVVRYRAIYTSMYCELSDDYAFHAPFYT